MNHSEPTKGEWFIAPEYPEYIQARKDKSTRQIAKTLAAGANSAEERNANARLMAASKDLLEALESMLALSKKRGEPCPDPEGEAIRATARAAIAKATVPHGVP